MSRTAELSTALTRIAAVAPKEFDELREAAAAYSAEQTTVLVNAAPGDLQRIQGRAQVAALLSSMITTIKPGAKP